MTNNWEAIREFYSNNGVFECGQRGDLGNNSATIEVCHILYKPLPDINQYLPFSNEKMELTPSHKMFFQFSNGAYFFTQRKNGKNRSGFALYPLDELENIHQKVITKIIEQEDSYLVNDDSAQGQKIRKETLDWLNSLLIIGEELNSGNYFAIDYSGPKTNDEYPIILLDHEDLYEENPLGNSVAELLLNASRNPAKFFIDTLKGNATYFDGNTSAQWFPNKYTPNH